MLGGAELGEIVAVFAYVVGVFAEQFEVAGVCLILLHKRDVFVKERFVAVHHLLERRRHHTGVRDGFGFRLALGLFRRFGGRLGRLLCGLLGSFFGWLCGLGAAVVFGSGLSRVMLISLS